MLDLFVADEKFLGTFGPRERTKTRNSKSGKPGVNFIILNDTGSMGGILCMRGGPGHMGDYQADGRYALCWVVFFFCFFLLFALGMEASMLRGGFFGRGPDIRLGIGRDGTCLLRR